MSMRFQSNDSLCIILDHIELIINSKTTQNTIVFNPNSVVFNPHSISLIFFIIFSSFIASHPAH